MGEWDDGLARHRWNFLKRLGAQRAEVRTPGGRDRLRAIRNAAKPPKRKGLDMTPTNRQLAITGLLILAIVLVVVVAEADGRTRQLGITTTQPKETPRTLTSRQHTIAAICDVFGSRCAVALRVASCETGGTLYPRSVGSAGERGLFQIHPVHFGWLNEARLWEVAYNARAAYRLSRGGRDWGHWSCRP